MAFSTHVKESAIEKIRWLLLTAFSMTSMVFALFLFWNFPDKDYLRYPYAALGVMWELGTIYCAIRLKTAFSQKQNWLGWLAAYIVFVSVSIAGGIGFNLATTGAESEVQQIARSRANEIEDSARSYRASIQKKIESQTADASRFEAMLISLDSTDPANAAQIRSLSRSKQAALDAAEKAADELRKYDTSRGELTKVAVVEDVKKKSISMDADVFGSLGGLLGMGGADRARKAFFAIIVIMIQVMILMSTPVLEESELKLKHSAKDLMRFIDAMFENGQGKRLASAHKVAKILNISPQERDSYMSLLSEITYKNEPLIRQGRGGTMTDYDVDNFKKIVTFYVEHPRGSFIGAYDEELSDQSEA